MDSFPFVGRKTELAELRTHIARCVAGYGGLILLSGEAGIGKSRMVLEATGSVAGDGPRQTVVIGRCLGHQETPPYGPWLEVVAQVAEQTGRTAHALPPPFGRDPGEWTVYEVAATLVSWLGSCDLPLIITIEDIHWADPASLDVLCYIAGRLGQASVLVLATYRIDELDPQHPLWARRPDLQRAGAQSIHLDRLGVEEIAALAREVLPSVARIMSLAERVHARTGGNTLFVRELLLAGSKVGVTALAEDAVLPETIQQAIDQKFCRVPHDDVAVLQVAAVIGERFRYRLLHQVLGVTEDVLDDILERAVMTHIIRTEGPGGHRFAFDHALLRDFLLSRLVGGRRRRWHLAVADALLSDETPDADAAATQLSHAGDPRAIEYLMSAGDRAFRLGALKQAQERYRQALDLSLALHPSRSELLLKLGCSVEPENPEQAYRYWREGLQRVAPADRGVAVWIRYQLAMWHYKRNDPNCLEAMASVQAEQAALLGDDRYRSIERDLFGEFSGYPRIGAWRALALSLAGQWEESQALFRVLHADAAPGSHHIDLLSAETFVALLAGNFYRAAALAQRVSEGALALGDYRMALLYGFSRLDYMLFCSDFAAVTVDNEAERLLQLAAEAHQRADYSFLDDGVIRGLLGCYQFMRGDWDRAEESLITHLERRSDQRTWVPRFWGAWLQLARGDLQGARTTFAVVSPRRPEDDTLVLDNLQVRAHWLRATFHLEAGELEEARRWLEAADRWHARGSSKVARAWIEMAWSAYHRLKGDASKAWEAAQQGLHSAQEITFNLQIIQAHRLVGELAADSGRVHLAAEHFQQALALAAVCDFPYELALTQLAYSRTSPPAPKSDDALAAAQKTFVQLGAAPALAAAGRVRRPGPTLPSVLPDGVTAREVDVIRLVARGLTNREAAETLYVSPRTVDGHLRNVFHKVGVNSRAALTAYALRHNLAD